MSSARLFALLLPVLGVTALAQEAPAYKNTDLPFQKRADDLLSRMTLEEKVSQMMNDSPAIDRLGIPAYNWWNECLHGVARAGRATVFPQTIGMAATWDTDLLCRVCRRHLRRGPRQVQRVRPPRQARHLPGPDLLDAEHQPVPRSALGPRHGDLRRRSVPDRPHGASRSSRACRATTRSTSRPSPPPSTTRSTAGPSRCATSSTR